MKDDQLQHFIEKEGIRDPRVKSVAEDFYKWGWDACEKAMYAHIMREADALVAKAQVEHERFKAKAVKFYRERIVNPPDDAEILRRIEETEL
jgi:hypothetical protein